MNKGVLAVVVVLGFWLFTDPHGLALFADAAAGALASWGDKLVTSVVEFLAAL